MADYKQATVSGTLWQRASQIIFNNPINGMPGVEFQEEQAVTVGDQTITNKVGNLHANFDNPMGTFNLINPMDGTVIGTAHYQDVYVMVYSLYLDLATKRDAAAQK